MNAYNISFQIYAENQCEVDEMKMAIVNFIETHRRANRAVTAKKCAKAISEWDRNIFVRNKIVEYFKN